ncbi:MAGa7180 family putative nuclease, partial [Metamycoplasma neophronis]
MTAKIKIPRRNFYNKQQYDLDFDNQVLVVKPDLLKSMQAKKPGTFGGFRKMTGSALGNIMELTSFDSQFAAFARLCNFAMPVLDPKYVNAGVVLEPRIVEKIEKSINYKLRRYDAKEFNYDFFKSNELFGGLPDGYCEELNLVIEIKTAGEIKLAQWNEFGVNPSYIKQAQLYTYLMGCEVFSIVACFLKEEDY